jgi:phosphatidylserine/phosphatidylglycerophosphate/cardiolipin synthase-like enzyme
MAMELDALLRLTLQDGTVSGSERDRIAEYAEAHLATAQDRAVARSRVFTIAQEALATTPPGNVLTWVERVLKALDPPTQGSSTHSATATFSPGSDCLGLIVHHLSYCRRSADICVFTITDDRITRAILAAHRRGIVVRVISDDEKSLDPGSDIEQLEAAGVRVVIDRTPFHMHHKYAIVDGERLLNGSYNWTRSAAEQNEENLLETGDPRLVRAFCQHFEQLWQQLGGPA